MKCAMCDQSYLHYKESMLYKDGICAFCHGTISEYYYAFDNPSKFIAEKVERFYKENPLYCEYYEQNRVCSFCQKEFDKEAPAIEDHDHSTGIVRGLVHFECNLRIGKWRKDNVGNLLNYLYNNQVDLLLSKLG